MGQDPNERNERNDGGWYPVALRREGNRETVMELLLLNNILRGSRVMTRVQVDLGLIDPIAHR